VGRIIAGAETRIGWHATYDPHFRPSSYEVLRNTKISGLRVLIGPGEFDHALLSSQF
jgi:hypothetical protein